MYVGFHFPFSTSFSVVEDTFFVVTVLLKQSSVDCCITKAHKYICFSLKAVVKSCAAHCFLLVWRTFLLAYAMLFYQIVLSSSDITMSGL